MPTTAASQAGLRLLAANQAVEEGRYAPALRLYDAAAALDPRSWEVHERRGRLLEACGYASAARGALRRAGRALEANVRDEPKNAALRLKAAEVHGANGRYEDELAQLEKAAALGGEDAAPLLRAAQLALWLGRPKRARSHAEAALARRPDAAAGWRLLGAVELLEKRYAPAAKHLERALALDLDDAEALIWRGELRRLRGRARPALEDLTRALALRRGWGDSLPALLNLTLARLDVKEPLVPLECERLRQYVPPSVAAVRATCFPNSAPVPLRRALEKTLAALAGNRAHPITFLVRRFGRRVAVRHARADPFGRREEYARVQRRCLLGGPRAALDEFDRMLAAGRETARLHAYRGEVSLWSGDVAAAEADLRRSLAMNDVGFVWPEIGMAGVRLLQGDFDEALACLERALVAGAPEQRVWIRRGEARLRRGELPAALADLRKATETARVIPPAFALRALAELRAGDASAAQELYRRLQAATPFFLGEAARAEGLPAAPGADAHEAVARVLERALTLMRGNRNSTIYTYVAPGGELREIRIKSGPAPQAAN